jgi:putative restriction endonuclease
MAVPADANLWLSRVAKIRAWQRDGIRAPHKPLLLLYALGRLQRSQSNTAIPFTEAEGPLKELLAEYGPPNPTSPGYPFHHLQHDDHLWQVRTSTGMGSPGPNLMDLRAAGVTGELDSAFAAALLSDPDLLVQVARYLLDSNFPSTLHDDIASAVGINLDGAAAASIVDLGQRRRRNPAFREQVLLAYEGRCAMCGWEGRLGRDLAGVEAAHVRWFTINGPDTLDNGLCLCSLHHKLFDLGAMGISADHKVTVSLHFVGHGEMADRFVYGLVGRELDEPQSGLPRVAAAHVAWHAAQVFRAPGRSVA